ncbi:PEP-CTERM sorting domain-containing protein [Paludisphaera soli]|uniref:PEP-CTERM sorting domain-containing protein n=1 Tax=Paludisphaera soli TaxID=2712865 RepID=UPI00197E8A6F|nr:PEP-CTERM sorting domain-containing protein [Paludisphaera soli]
MIGKLCLALSLVAAVATPNLSAGSVAIADLYNTGVDSSHVLLATGEPDLNYTLAHAGSPTTPVANRLAGTWVPDTSIARWIVPQGSMPNGTYTYSTTFTVGADADLASASILGRLTADDTVDDVLLNGNSLGISTGDQSYGTWYDLAINDYFQVGENVLTFVTRNTNGGPTGLIVEMTGSYNAVPEPSSMALLGLGAVGALACRRLRRRPA